MCTCAITAAATQLILYDPISSSDPVIIYNHPIAVNLVDRQLILTHSHTLFCVEPVICPDLTIMNGMVITSPANRTYMSTTSYVCDEGFVLKGDGNRMCQIDDTWTGTDPECGE